LPYHQLSEARIKIRGIDKVALLEQMRQSNLHADNLRHLPKGDGWLLCEIADAAAFLCSGASPFLTGANIPIDGGYSRV